MAFSAMRTLLCREMVTVFYFEERFRLLLNYMFGRATSSRRRLSNPTDGSVSSACRFRSRRSCEEEWAFAVILAGIRSGTV